MLLVAGNLLFKIADLVIQRGVSLGVVVRLFLYYLPGVVVLTIPMGSLLAALLGFGRLSANVEIVALKAAGVAFLRIVSPVMDLSRSPEICPRMVAMSGGSGWSLARMAAASVEMPATRWVNSSAAGSGLMARKRVATSLS